MRKDLLFLLDFDSRQADVRAVSANPVTRVIFTKIHSVILIPEYHHEPTLINKVVRYFTRVLFLHSIQNFKSCAKDHVSTKVYDGIYPWVADMRGKGVTTTPLGLGFRHAF